MDKFRNQWTREVFQKATPAESINVTFRNGSNANYTTRIMELLKTDPATVLIISNETGEILFER